MKKFVWLKKKNECVWNFYTVFSITFFLSQCYTSTTLYYNKFYVRPSLNGTQYSVTHLFSQQYVYATKFTWAAASGQCADTQAHINLLGAVCSLILISIENKWVVRSWACKWILTVFFIVRFSLSVFSRKFFVFFFKCLFLKLRMNRLNETGINLIPTHVCNANQNYWNHWLISTKTRVSGPSEWERESQRECLTTVN